VGENSMSNLSNGYKLDEIIELTSISKRNIKFWCSVYKILPKKIGRTNYYSEAQFQLLKLINTLSSIGFFTQKFIRVIVDYNQSENPNQVVSQYGNFVFQFDRFLSDNSLLKLINLDIFDKSDRDIISSLSTRRQNQNPNIVLEKSQTLNYKKNLSAKSKTDGSIPITKKKATNRIEPVNYQSARPEHIAPNRDIAGDTVRFVSRKQDSYLL